MITTLLTGQVCVCRREYGEQVGVEEEEQKMRRVEMEVRVNAMKGKGSNEVRIGIYFDRGGRNRCLGRYAGLVSRR